MDRKYTSIGNWILDNLVPPILRDNDIFMSFLMYIMFRKKKKYFMEFKEKSPLMTIVEYKRYYKVLSDVHIKRPTDLNEECIEKILKSIKGRLVLDIGCGRGFLANLIVKDNIKKVTGIDIYIADNLKKSRNPCFIENSVELLPFKNKSFDTVICTHTIEHVLEPKIVIEEMRRVARKKIIIVVPRQREYKYTFDLHLNFFPYIFDLLRITKSKNGRAMLLNNDIYYEENI